MHRHFHYLSGEVYIDRRLPSPAARAPPRGMTKTVLVADPETIVSTGGPQRVHRTIRPGEEQWISHS